MTAYRSLRALSALALAASVAGCSFDTFTGESGEAVDAVARLVDLMEGGDYDGAQAEACPDEADVTAASLRTEFEPLARPWKRKVWATTMSDASGGVNLALTPSKQSKIEYAFTMRDDGNGWRVCDVSRGSWDVSGV
jgi:hypothetical protein